jgi:hypothetical protein
VSATSRSSRTARGEGFDAKHVSEKPQHAKKTVTELMQAVLPAEPPTQTACAA